MAGERRICMLWRSARWKRLVWPLFT